MLKKKVCFIGHRHIYNYKEIREKLYNIVEEEIKNGCNFLQWAPMENLMKWL